VTDKNPHELTPTKFDVNKFRRSKVNQATEDTTPDQFGQTYNADYDRSKWSERTPQESRKAHIRSDVDLGPRSLHHTLGPKHNQASPGDHIHDGITSKKIGPLEMDTTPGNEGQTRAEWTIPAAPTVADIVDLLEKFVNFRQV
jgi:hypothetical protein